jgi:arsenate reductase
LNRHGTTWRKLDLALRESIVDASTAKRLMIAQSSVIKRPVVQWADGSITVGFDPTDWSSRPN